MSGSMTMSCEKMIVWTAKTIHHGVTYESRVLCIDKTYC